jgi:membrane-associated protease RseP (regulator of RpoE activity)
MPSSEAASPRVPAPAPARLSWRVNAGLFVATVASCFVTWMEANEPSRVAVLHAAEYTAALMVILLAHEFGHYIAARLHRVDASLPFFLPLPIISPFGTLGAVIRMRQIIPTRRALLDIGAAGPLAGIVLAIPLYAWGIGHSRLVVVSDMGGGSFQLGSSLLTLALDRAFGPTVPDGMDVMLSPVAFAGWAGMFVTMINLLPVGQLDGGHVAFALFGPRQNKIAQWVHRSLLVFFFVGVASFVARDVRGGFGLWRLGRHVDNSIFWLVWFEMLAVLGTLSSSRSSDRLGAMPRIVGTVGLALVAAALREQTSLLLWAAWFVGLGVLLAMEVRWGALGADATLLDHPPTSTEPLRAGRAAIAIVSLVLFVALFMPAPISM